MNIILWVCGPQYGDISSCRKEPKLCHLLIIIIIQNKALKSELNGIESNTIVTNRS